jgi:hypothetical protein
MNIFVRLSVPSVSTSFLCRAIAFNNMAHKPDVSHQSDISKMKTEHDGSFKRAASSFRSTIVKGGDFEPVDGK